MVMDESLRVETPSSHGGMFELKGGNTQNILIITTYMCPR
jgi:hypothetical protein